MYLLNSTDLSENQLSFIRILQGDGICTIFLRVLKVVPGLFVTSISGLSSPNVQKSHTYLFTLLVQKIKDTKLGNCGSGNDWDFLDRVDPDRLRISIIFGTVELIVRKFYVWLVRSRV